MDGSSNFVQWFEKIFLSAIKYMAKKLLVGMDNL